MLDYSKVFQINENIINKKYDKNIVYNKLFNKNITKVIDSNKLFYKSMPYISSFQKELSNRNIENYISGGFALKLYLNDYLMNNKNILLTKDCDCQYYEIFQMVPMICHVVHFILQILCMIIQSTQNILLRIILLKMVQKLKI